MAPKTKLEITMFFSVEGLTPTSCRETYFTYVKNRFRGSVTENFLLPKMVLLFSPKELMTEEVISKFIKLMDLLVGNAAVALAPLETLTLDGYNPGAYELLPPTTGNYRTYELGKCKIAYTALPVELTLFDPMLMSVLYGLAKVAHLLLFYDLEDEVLSVLPEEETISAIKNKYRDKAYYNMIQVLSVLYKINRQHHFLGKENIMSQRSDVTAILRLRAQLRDLPLSSIKNNWIQPYKYDNGRYLFHNWKKEKFPDAWAARRAAVE